MEEILHHAEQLEKEYDWLGAAELYRKVLNLLAEEGFSRKGKVTERLGYAFYRAAFQAENNDEFGERMHQSVANYQRGKEFYGKLNEQVRAPMAFRCDAMIAYLGYWLASEVSEKKRLLDECWRLTKEALKAFEEVKDALEYGKTYNQLCSSAFDRYAFEWSFQARERLMKEAMEYGERAITLLSGVSDSHELARAYAKTAMYITCVGYFFVSDMDEKEGYYRKSFGYWQKANELSEETAFLELVSVTGEGLEWSIDELLAHYDKALDYAKKTKDRLTIGTTLDWLAYATHWKALGINDPDRRLAFHQKALQYAKNAVDQYSSISYTSPRGGTLWTGAPYARYYYTLALWETNLRKKRDFLEKAATEGTNAIKQAENTGYPQIVMLAHYTLVQTLVYLAQLEMDSEQKRKLLEKASEHSTEMMKISDELERFVYWNAGRRCCVSASLKAELSDVERDTQRRKNMLEEAASFMERGLQLCIKHILYLEKTEEPDPARYVLGNQQYTFGEWLSRLSALTNSSEDQRRAIKSFEEAAQSFQKLNMFSRVAECRWKAAGSSDILGEHLKAAENFSMASNDYRSAAEKIPQLKGFYQDYAVYMEAWNEIEKARHHHTRQEYDLAKGCYEKAATVHKSLKQWSYLAPNYFAWAQVENAEDLSRSEKSEEALQAFTKAAKLFTETKKSLETKLEEIENIDEKTMATNLSKASDTRQEYCLGRMALEEAKILDKKGDHSSSSQKYGEAAQAFETIIQAMESEQEKKELKLIATLSQAWQRMTCAEAEESPQLYLEASQLFEEAKDLSPNEQAKTLTLGHSRFCKALEAGTRFADSGDATLHQIAEQHLESAAKYYVRAGFQNASEYSKAMEYLFDAYLYMDDAKREKDPEKKAKLYTMAEKILQTSAGSFMKAEHPEKREQVLRLLEKVKEERELALSLNEVLHAPTVVSTTTVFSAPTPTHENAVGLDRFEHADIQANLIIREKELKIGENLSIELEMVNAGKGSALLTKVTEIIPEGFELSEKPDNCRVEDSYLNLRGKRLDPLKMEEVKLVLKPTLRGTFSLKPTVLYLDENGKYKSHEPEPVMIVVKELGVKGWIKGER